jgi:acyl-CoA hydrolase
MTKKSLPPRESAVEHNIYKVFPNDLNSHQSIFGGVVMSLCDRSALVVAERHSGCVCVTAAVDNLNFVAPAKEGDTLIIKASINRAWSSSMEVGVKVFAENSLTRDIRHIVSAYLTFVALGKDEKPACVPAVCVETKNEERRFNEASVRRQSRLTTRETILKLRKNHKSDSL